MTEQLKVIDGIDPKNQI